MSSGYGFICAGCGDRGLFAIITINPHTILDDGIEWGSNQIVPKTKPVVKLIDYGEHILNSVTIDLIRGVPELGIFDDAVAVMTSNDHTVRFFSLGQHTESACLDLAFPVNHASISPDGNTMVAVGDYQRAYFFEKWQLSAAESKVSTSEYASNHVEWLELRLVDLHVAKMTQVIGYFATSWSGSGKYCAVASECGYITVFDMEKLLSHPMVEEPIPVGEAPIIVTPSSRPDVDNGPGAVRAMTFSPSPYDLLIWMEGQGRVCVADLRDGLQTRQVVHLDTNMPSATVPQPPVENAPEADDISYRGFPDPDVFLATIASRRRLRTATPPSTYRTMSDRERTSTTVTNEGDGTSWQWVFDRDGLHLNREAEQAAQEESARPIVEQQPQQQLIQQQQQSLRLQRLQQQEQLAQLQLQRLRQQQQQLEQLEQQQQEHRQQRAFTSRPPPPPQAPIDGSSYSGQLSTHERILMDDLYSTGRPRPRDWMRNGNVADLARYQQYMASEPRHSRTQTETINHDIETPRVRGPWRPVHNGEDFDEPTTPVERARQRAMKIRKAGQLHPNMEKMISQRMSGMGSDIHGVHMTGLCLSRDGRSLCVGSERGFFELKLNLTPRLYFPAIELR
jgi:TolA-binding protein